jgi:mannose-6-phosphate isomerase-like protein (cupin superfamily)
VEAPFEETEHGLVCKGDGWFLVNARDVRWRREGTTATSNFGGDTLFDQLGIGIRVLGPGEPMAVYHWETDEEDFVVLSGSGTVVLDGEEHPLRQWDVVHCPPGVAHVIVGGPITVLGVGARERHTMIGEDGQRTGRPDWGEYVADAVAAKYGASPPRTTTSNEVAYEGWPPAEPARYGGWLD